MHQAEQFQFERAVHEFAQWQGLPEDERSPAPAWWWGPAFAVKAVQQPMPAEWCDILGLSYGAAYSDGADIFLSSLARQELLPRTGDFPRKNFPAA